MAETRAPLDLTLPNLGPGPSPLSLSAFATSTDFVVVLLQRGHRCTNCRGQVQAVADRVADCRERGAASASSVPEPVETVREWQASDALHVPLLADPDATAGAAFDQPVRFGLLDEPRESPP